MQFAKPLPAFGMQPFWFAFSVLVCYNKINPLYWSLNGTARASLSRGKHGAASESPAFEKAIERIESMMDKKRIEAAVKEILEAVGEDTRREGLQETPARVAKMYEEIFSGMHDDPTRHLKIFHEPAQNNELVIVRDIPMYSVCEHHLLPFVGNAHIAYIPKNGKIIGLSKFARIVDCFARRPQVQERLTSQIADFLFEHLQPYGVAVVIEAEHLCMTMRGARAAGAKTQTSALRGIMKSDAKSRSEVMTLLTGGNRL